MTFEHTAIAVEESKHSEHEEQNSSDDQEEDKVANVDPEYCQISKETGRSKSR